MSKEYEGLDGLRRELRDTAADWQSTESSAAHTAAALLIDAEAALARIPALVGALYSVEPEDSDYWNNLGRWRGEDQAFDVALDTLIAIRQALANHTKGKE